MKNVAENKKEIQRLLARRAKLQDMTPCRVVLYNIEANTQRLADVTGFPVYVVRSIYR